MLATVYIASVFARADAAPPTSLDVTGKRVTFYSDRYEVTADGNVRVRLSDGTIITGETFAMDLKLNRYLIAGNVHLDSGNVHEVGAGFAGYPDLDRSYFLPANATPDRWTYFGLNFADPHLGRQQPGDAFYFPDLSGQKAYIVAKGATIIPKTNVIFDEAAVRAIGPVYVPTPRYVVTFSSNSHFYENGFFGARFDISEPFNGSAHSLTALHLRNDPVNGTYLALDQHFVWDRDWIVMSIDPLTQETRQYNLIGYKRFSNNLEGRLFQQITEAQPGGPQNPPISASGYTNVQFNAALKRSGLAFNLDQYNWTLLGIPNVAFDKQFFPLQLEHPIDMSLSWTGFENRLARKGIGSQLFFRLRSGIGYAHDQYGEGGYLTYQPGPQNLWYKYVGYTLYTPSLRLGKFYNLTASLDKQRQWYSIPHHVDQTNFTSSLSRTLDKLNAYLVYSSATTGDYWGAQQLAEYPVPANSLTNSFGTFTGMAAFRGFATTRTAQLGLVYTPTTYFGLNVQLVNHHDWPAPIPGLYGQPPWQVNADAHFRLARQVQVDIFRSYYFNFANLRWTPQLGIQFSP